MGKIAQKLPDAHFPSFVAGVRAPLSIGDQSANNNFRKEHNSNNRNMQSKQKSKIFSWKQAIKKCMIHINNFRKEQNSKNRNIYAVNAKINIYIGFSQLWEGLEAKLLTPGQLLGYPWKVWGITVQTSYWEGLWHQNCGYTSPILFFWRRQEKSVKNGTFL